MEKFYGGGGNNRPYFPYRIKVKAVTNEMHKWCNDYEIVGARHFARWHCEFADMYQRDYDVVQFECEEAAIMFALKFGDQ